MFSAAEKTNTHHANRSKQSGAPSFFRKAGEESFFGNNRQSSFFSTAVQAKLSVSQPDDPQEKEADAMADKVMRMPEPVAAPATQKQEEKLNRKEEKEDEKVQKKEESNLTVVQPQQDKEEEKKIHPKLFGNTIHRSALSYADEPVASGESETVVSRKSGSIYHSDVIQCSGRGPPAGFMHFENNLSSSKGQGAPMPAETQQFMQSRFSADFSAVRIHTGSYAEHLSRTINAQAFTHGNDIYFNSGKYNPNTAAGGTLLAHELTHTIQQGASKTTDSPARTAASVQRKEIIQRVPAGPVPQLTNAVEKAKSKEGKVNAGKEGADGFREGWQDLVDFFKTTFGADKIISGAGGTTVPGTVAEQDIKKKRTATGMIVNKADVNGDRITGERDAMPSWCGIFVFWALNKSGVPMPKWTLGKSVIKPKAAYPKGYVPKTGDIAYKEGYSHYAIVESATGDTVKTVNGNTAGEDNLGGQIQTRDHPMSNWTAFFNPLLNMEGTLGSGEAPVAEKPKTLRELRRELFHVSRKPGGEHEEDHQNGDAANAQQAKPALSGLSVNVEGYIHASETTVQAKADNEIIQSKEEEKKEEKISAPKDVVVQQKSATVFTNGPVSCCNEAGSDNESLHGHPISNEHSTSSLTGSGQASNIAVDRTRERGPPVAVTGSEKIQCGWFDSAINFVNSAIDYVAEGLEAGKRLLLREARDFVMAIPGYRALRVVLGEDPITSEVVERNGRNFIEAAFDIMPGGRQLHQKLTELGALDEAASFIDRRIAEIEGIVHNVINQVERFWNGLTLESLASPRKIFEDAGNIIHNTISSIITFAENAARELLAIVKRWLLNQIVEFVRTRTTAYPLLCVIIGHDPVTEQPVARNGTNILNALLELGGEEGRQQRTQMQQTGTYNKVVGYIDEGIAVFGNLYQTIRNNFGLIWDVVSIDALMHPVDTFNHLYETFAEPVRRVWDFVRRVAAEILKFIKEVLLQRLSAWARQQRGYALVTVIIGRDPFTQQPVPFTMENVIKGFFSLMEGGEEQYNQLKESGAIDRTVAKINAAVARLNMTPASIIQLFIDLWHSFSLNDLAHPIQAFQRIIARFGEPIARLIAFVVEIVKIVIEAILIVMNFPFDLINNIIARAMAAFERIKRDPVGFLKNLLRAIKQGFIQFFDNILTHLLNGLVGWLMSELRDANVPEPQDFSLRGIISWVLQILGISMEAIWQKLAQHPRIGPQRVARIRSMINTLEGIWTFIKDVQERGVAAIWDKIQEQLSNLWQTILSAVKNWVMEQIINRIVARLLSMLDPTGIMAVVNSAIAIYRAIQSFVKYLRQMLEVVNSFVNGVADIAEGNISTAANYLERTMGRAMPIVIGFLANQVGLSGIGRRIAELIGAARELVDRALTWLVNKAVDTAFGIIDRLMAIGRSARDAVLGWLGLRKEFSTDNGLHHEIYFTGSGRNTRLIAASNIPEAMETKVERRLRSLRRNRAANQTKITALETALSIKQQMDQEVSRHTGSQDTANQSTSDIQPQIDGFLERIKQQLVIGGLDEPDLPLTNVTFQMQAGKAYTVTAQPLTKLAGNTAGSDADGNPVGWNIATFQNSTRTRPGETTSSGRPRRIIQWRQVHLLSAVLHGPGSENWNLTPTNDVANGNLRTRERRVYDELNNTDSPAVYTMYQTIVEYNNPNSPQTHPVAGAWNTADFPSAISLRLQKEGEGSPTLIPIASNLPYPQTEDITQDVDYFARFKTNIDGYFAETERSERDSWYVFARTLNLQRAIPNEAIRQDVTNRLRDYYNANK